MGRARPHEHKDLTVKLTWQEKLLLICYDVPTVPGVGYAASSFFLAQNDLECSETKTAMATYAGSHVKASCEKVHY